MYIYILLFTFASLSNLFSRIMERTVFNDVQMHLLQMFSYSKTQQEMDELKDVLAQYYAERVQMEADRLWDNGTLGQEAIDNILSEHLRTPYLNR